MPETRNTLSPRSSRSASKSVAGPPVRSSPTIRSLGAHSFSISERAAWISVSVASTLRERSRSPSSSRTQTQWDVLPTSKPTQKNLLTCSLPPSFVLASSRHPQNPPASLPLHSDLVSQLLISGLGSCYTVPGYWCHNAST